MELTSVVPERAAPNRVTGDVTFDAFGRAESYAHLERGPATRASALTRWQIDPTPPVTRSTRFILT